MPDGHPARTERKISSFLAEHRDADLFVCTGYTSVKGLAWLSRHVSSHQRVTLVIGDMTPNNFTKATETDRATASMFLRRNNLTVHNWYRSKPTKKIAHGKAIVAKRGGRTVAALVGSANLTETGLSNNLEMMVRCHPDDWGDLQAYLNEAMSHPPANTKLVELVGSSSGSDRRRSQPYRAPAKTGSGCLGALVLLPIQTAVQLWNRLRLRSAR